MISQGLLRHYSPKNKWLRSGRCVDPSNHNGRRPGVPWPSPRAPIPSGEDLQKALRCRPPSCLQNRRPPRDRWEHLPGLAWCWVPGVAPDTGAGARVKTQLNETHRTEGSRTRLRPPETTGARNRNADNFCPVAGGRIGEALRLGALEDRTWGPPPGVWRESLRMQL
ncbi:hypothetical protein NDU88_002355 [Pleurodeles waltl]|uniref:Uncharacterized protein n=1 Tax=Pleurodeles waltl TaxID=8319 RepID=A0AAV7SDF7_PLEWA|nr:hypothetical protein NDU88_002355 [Pleurodeles waltl]